MQADKNIQQLQFTGEPPLVSICCLCYNHASFLKDCLEGFVSQKANFGFEVLIHDDASSDDSAAIIREYQIRYPNIIFPIFQDENQYSKQKRLNIRYNFPRARGKYIALCEGDDYWTDSNKLARMVEYLEKNDEYVIAFHNMNLKYESGLSMGPSHSNDFSGHTSFGISDLAQKGNFIWTASVVFKRNFQDLPSWFFDLPIGDYPLHLFNAQFGRLIYFPDVMGTYRVHAKGSLSMIDPGVASRKWIRMLEILEDKFSDETNRLLRNQRMDALWNLYLDYSRKSGVEDAKDILEQLITTEPLFVYRKFLQEKNNAKRISLSNSYRIGNKLVKAISLFKPKRSD